MKKCAGFEEEKGTMYIWGNVYFGIIVFSCLSSTKPCLRFLLICFAQEINVFYQSSLENEIDFRDFDQKIGVFQQTVVRVYYILKNPKQSLSLTTHECLPICIISEKHNEQI